MQYRILWHLSWLLVFNWKYAFFVNAQYFIDKMNQKKSFHLYLIAMQSWAGVAGAVDKISAFQPQGPQFDPLLFQGLNWFVRLSFPPKLTQLSILLG